MIDHFLGRVRSVIPDVEAGTSYGMSCLMYRGKPLVAVVATRSGWSVYPFSGSVVARVVAEHAVPDASKGAVRFTAANPLSDAAFDALVAVRRDEIDALADARGDR